MPQPVSVVLKPNDTRLRLQLPLPSPSSFKAPAAEIFLRFFCCLLVLLVLLLSCRPRGQFSRSCGACPVPIGTRLSNSALPRSPPLPDTISRALFASVSQPLVQRCVPRVGPRRRSEIGKQQLWCGLVPEAPTAVRRLSPISSLNRSEGLPSITSMPETAGR